VRGIKSQRDFPVAKATTLFEVWAIPPGRFRRVRKGTWGNADWQMALKQKRSLEIRGYEEVRLREVEIELDDDEDEE
jgi:hypothetical protein